MVGRSFTFLFMFKNIVIGLNNNLFDFILFIIVVKLSTLNECYINY